MQKFALIVLAASAALLGFVTPVESQALENRETNADRFARGMPPLPPAKRTETESMSILYFYFLFPSSLFKVNLAADEEGPGEQWRSAKGPQNGPPRRPSTNVVGPRSVTLSHAPGLPSVPSRQHLSSALGRPSVLSLPHSSSALALPSVPLRRRLNSAPGHLSVLLPQLKSAPGRRSVLLLRLRSVPGHPSAPLPRLRSAPGLPSVPLPQLSSAPGHPSVPLHRLRSVPGLPSVPKFSNCRSREWITLMTRKCFPATDTGSLV